MKIKEDTQKTSVNKSLFSFLFVSTGNKIGDTGATSMSEALKSNARLTKLILTGDDKRKKTHQRHPSIKHYIHILTDNQIGDAGVKSLSESLKSNVSLIKLDLCCKDKKDTPKTSINNSLFSFLVTSPANEFGDAGATSLSEALKSNTILTKLLLKCECKERRHTKDIHQQITLFFTSHQQTTRLETQEQRR